MTTVHLDDFLDDGILKEKSFREKVNKQTGVISRISEY